MKTKILILSTLLLVCLTQPVHAEHQMDEIPMYDGQHNPQITENKEFSENAAQLGWKYYYSGDYPTAIKRFNQAWMFNRNNPEAFWGFGLIMGARSKEENPKKNLNESIKFLEKADTLSKNNPRIMIDLAYSETVLGYFLKGTQKKGFQSHFDKAEILFKESKKLEKTYPLLYSNWSVLYFYEEKYIEAKEKLDIAKNLGFKPNPDYEKDLTTKLNISKNKIQK